MANENMAWSACQARRRVGGGEILSKRVQGIECSLMIGMYLVGYGVDQDKASFLGTLTSAGHIPGNWRGLARLKREEFDE